MPHLLLQTAESPESPCGIILSGSAGIAFFAFVVVVVVVAAVPPDELNTVGGSCRGAARLAESSHTGASPRRCCCSGLTAGCRGFAGRMKANSASCGRRDGKCEVESDAPDSTSWVHFYFIFIFFLKDPNDAPTLTSLCFIPDSSG